MTWRVLGSRVVFSTRVRIRSGANYLYVITANLSDPTSALVSVSDFLPQDPTRLTATCNVPVQVCRT